MMYRSRMCALGAYLPEKIVTNTDLSQHLDTSDAWILSRTGIQERRVAATDESAADLGAHAAQDALKNADCSAQDIDILIVATTTSERIFPSTAVQIQRRIGAHNAFAFDVQAVCSGFIYALSVADSMLKTGQGKRALVIGTETMSRIVNPEDRSTAVLFGDGAGAAVLESEPLLDAPSHNSSGILSTHLYSDGNYEDALYVDGGVGTQNHGYIQMEGRKIFRMAVDKLGAAIQSGLQANGLNAQDIDWFVPHQANLRIIHAVSDLFHLPRDKVVVTIDRHGNTSAASIPLALYEIVSQNKVKRGDLIVCESMGGGLTWGSAVIRW